jgi:hypothetical protein
MTPFMWLVTEPAKRKHVLQLTKQAFNVPETVPHVPVDNPVSLDRSNIALLRQQDYMVAFKADGIRYLLVLTMYKNRPLAAFVNRAGQVYSLYVTAHASHFQHGSVFDGELCSCNTGNNAQDFLVFNALVDQGTALHDQSYHTRLQHIRDNFSAQPLSTKERERNILYICPMALTLNFVYKEYDFAYNMRAMHHNITPRYKTDGFVFTPIHAPVISGRNDQLLKWKNDNPIDVQLCVTETSMDLLVDNDGTQILLQSVVAQPVHMDNTNNVYFNDIIAGYNIFHQLFKTGPCVFDSVIEVDCRFQPQHALQLRFVRLRPDKDGPNNVGTVLRTLQTIQDNIQQEEIYDFVLRNRM